MNIKNLPSAKFYVIIFEGNNLGKEISIWHN